MSDVSEAAGIPPVPDSPPVGGALVRPIVGVTLLTVGLQGTTLLVHVLMARLFGAGPDLDAYLAAFAMPQYVTAIVVGVLSAVCIPVIIGTAEREGIDEARRVAQGITLVVMTAMVGLTAICAVFSSPLLGLSTPGLPPPVHQAATGMAWLLWLTVLGTTGVAIATSVENAQYRFLRAALVPFAGSVLNIALLALLARPFGIVGAAVATTAGALVQLLLLWTVFDRRGESLHALVARPGVREALSLLWPLIVSGVFLRVTIVGERYFASMMPTGSITHISYASRMIAPLALLLSTGIATVLFPRMSQQSAVGNLEDLGAGFSTALRLMWILVAPATLIGIALSRPITGALYEGGRFTSADAGHVASLLQIYLLALAGSAIGVITGKVLYALKAARLLAVAGVIEGVAYVLYTSALVRTLGARGVAWGFVLYVTAALVWHILYVTVRIRWTRLASTAWSVVRTTVAAGAAALVAHAVVGRLAGAWTQAIAGGAASLIAFVALMLLVNRADALLMINAVAGRRARKEAA